MVSDDLTVQKVVTLPSTLSPNTIYLLKKDSKFKMYVTDSTGATALVMVPEAAANMYTKAGVITPKYFTGEAKANNGNWSINYSIANFTKVHTVLVTGAYADNQDANSAPGAAVNKGTITTTGCSGDLRSRVVFGKVTMGSNGYVQLLVIGE